MNREQFIEHCVNNGVPKVNAIVYCNALNQDLYTDDDYQVLKRTSK